jgi:FkbM family methyltransferase
MKINNIHQMYDHHTFLIMRMVLNKNSSCVDVGAHVGSVLKEIVDLSPLGEHYAFEPIPYLFSGLKSSHEFQGVNLYDIALSDQSGEDTFFLVKNAPAFSGLKQRRYDCPDPEIQEIKVKKNRLDDIIPIGHKIDFIKIDVEGGELPVLRGAERVIRESMPFIVFESGLGASEHYGTTGSSLYEFLTDNCGLEINSLDGYLTGSSGLTKNELIDVFSKTERYYFITHRPLLDHERHRNFRNYVLDIDSRLYSLNELPANVLQLGSQLEALLPRAQVRDWGKKETFVGKGVNIQPDGTSAMWIKTVNVSPFRDAYVYFGDHRATGRATIQGELITTTIPNEVIENVGEYEVVIAEAFGRRTTVGIFKVKP